MAYQKSPINKILEISFQPLMFGKHLLSYWLNREICTEVAINQFLGDHLFTEVWVNIV